MVPVIEESSDSDDTERAKEELDHWHKNRKINNKEKDYRKRREEKMFSREEYEAKLKRNPRDKSLPKKPDIWENNKAAAKKRSKFGAWKKMKVEPTTPDILKRQMEKGKIFRKEWWYSPSHIFTDVTDHEEKFLNAKMDVMVKGYHDTRESIMYEFRRQNWGPVLDKIRNCLTEMHQTQLVNEPYGKKIM
jgi:hypothetical protein